MHHNCSIKDDNDVKFPLAYIKTMQKTNKVPVLEINKIAPSIKAIMDRKELNVNIRKV